MSILRFYELLSQPTCTKRLVLFSFLFSTHNYAISSYEILLHSKCVHFNHICIFFMRFDFLSEYSIHIFIQIINRHQFTSYFCGYSISTKWNEMQWKRKNSTNLIIIQTNHTWTVTQIWNNYTTRKIYKIFDMHACNLQWLTKKTEKCGFFSCNSRLQWKLFEFRIDKKMSFVYFTN